MNQQSLGDDYPPPRNTSDSIVEKPKNKPYKSYGYDSTYTYPIDNYTLLHWLSDNRIDVNLDYFNDYADEDTAYFSARNKFWVNVSSDDCSDDGHVTILAQEQGRLLSDRQFIAYLQYCNHGNGNGGGDSTTTTMILPTAILPSHAAAERMAHATMRIRLGRLLSSRRRGLLGVQSLVAFNVAVQ